MNRFLYSIVLLVSLMNPLCYGMDTPPSSPLSSKARTNPCDMLNVLWDSAYGVALLTVCVVKDIPDYIKLQIDSPESTYSPHSSPFFPPSQTVELHGSKYSPKGMPLIIASKKKD